jgi:hypothetical protein
MVFVTLCTTGPRTGRSEPGQSGARRIFWRAMLVAIAGRSAACLTTMSVDYYLAVWSRCEQYGEIGHAVSASCCQGGWRHRRTTTAVANSLLY